MILRLPILFAFLSTTLFAQGETDSSLRDLQGWTVHSLNSKSLKILPIRGIQNYLPLFPGIAEVNGALHFRGSRAGEVAYLIDGFSVTNPYFNSNGVPVIPEAIEELQVHTGAYGVMFGSGNGGVVVTRMRTGGESIAVSLDYQTDELSKPGSEFLKTTVQGYKNIVWTLGGPVLENGIRFFIAGQHSYMHNRQPMFFEPFAYDSLVTDDLGFHPQGTPLPGPLRFNKNYLDNNWSSSTVIQGNSTIDLEDLQLKVMGSYSFEESPEQSKWPHRLTNYYRQKRSMMNEATTIFGGVQATYFLGEDTRLQASLSIHDRYARQFDPDFGDDWDRYADSVANARAGYDGFVNRYTGPHPYSTIYAFSFLHPHSPNNTYTKDAQMGLGGSLRVSHEFSPMWRISGEAMHERWKLRYYHVGDIRSYWLNLDQDRDGTPDRTFIDELERRTVLSRAGSMTYYGYHYLGNELDNGIDGARRPTLTSFAVDNTILGEQMSLNVGGIYKIFSSDILTIPNFENPAVDLTYGIIEEKEFNSQEPVHLFLPRISTSFKLSSRTIVSGAYGSFAQVNAYQNLYLSQLQTTSRISPSIRVPYWFGAPLVGSFAQPERSTTYEIGLGTMLRSNVKLGIRYFVKSLKRQLEPGHIYAGQNEPIFVALLNKGVGEAKGMEVGLELNSSEYLLISAWYTYLMAKGTTSHPFGLRREMSDIFLPPTPYQLFPLDYDQTHRGTVVASLSFDEEEGVLLDGFNLTTILTFNSGHRYTRIESSGGFGLANPWNVGVRELLDPRTADPVEPVNSSTTPWVFNINLHISKSITLPFLSIELYANILNLLNTRHVVNLYPTTSSSTTDGWLADGFAQYYKQFSLYEDFYRAINEKNRWAYIEATGNDLYGAPRQIRVGLKLTM